MKEFLKTLQSETLKKVRYILAKGDTLKLVIIFFGMLVGALLEIAGIGMIPAFVAVVADPDRVMQLTWLQPVLHTLDITTAKDLLIWGSLALVGIFLIKSAYVITFNYFEARFIYNRRYLVSQRLMSSYMQAPYTFHLQHNTAELLRNITEEVNILSNIVITNLLLITRETLITVAILGFLFAVEPLITLVVIGLSGLGAGGFMVMNRNKMKKFGEEEQRRRSAMIKAVQQGLGGIKDARVLNREREFIDKFSTEALESTRLKAYLRFIQQIPKPVVETTAVIGMLLISMFLVLQGRDISVIVPILTLFAMATVKLMPSLQQLSSLYTNLRYNLVAIDPIYNDLKSLQESRIRFLKDRENEAPLILEEEIEVQNVWYEYPESEEQALKGLSLIIPKGKAIAFVGESGAGKTTIVDLLLGLLEPQEGGVYVDGKNIGESLSAWQRNIGYIPQSIYLADESLRNNIAFGLPEDEIEDEKIKKAVRLAQLESMVKKLPDGLDTLIGENGTRISGGQRQRVGIARALYHQPNILIMDEATSALDNITEKQITKAIEALRGDRTLIMIAHRLTTVQNCDKLYLMSDGKIVAEGSYDELISQNQEFRNMALVSDKG